MKKCKGTKILGVIALIFTMLFMMAGCGQEKAKTQPGAPAAPTASNASPIANIPSVWVISSDTMDAAVYRIDPATNKEIAKIPFDGSPGGVAVTVDGVWVTDFAYDKVVRIDPADHKVKASINTGKGPKAVTTSPGTVWVANSVEGTVTRVDSASNTVVATINVTNSALNSLSFFDNALWVAGTDFTVYKIDPQTNQVTAKINVGTVPGGIAGKSGILWAAAPVANQLLRIDTNNKKPEAVLKTDNSIAVAMLQDKIAVANNREGTVSIVNIADNSKVDIKAGNNLASIAAGYGSIWVTSSDENALYRIDPVSKSVMATINIKRAAKVAAE